MVTFLAKSYRADVIVASKKVALSALGGNTYENVDKIL